MNKLIISVMLFCFGIIQANAEATDISSYTDVVYASNATAVPGEQVTLSINMKNSFDAPGFQFDLVLPEGFSVAKDADNMYMVALSTERTTAKKTNYFDGALQTDGSFRILCNTSAKDTSTGKLYVFSGNDGEVCTITLDVAATVAYGTYEIGLKNIEISDLNSVGHPLTDVIKSTITVVNNETPRAEQLNSLPEGYKLEVVPFNVSDGVGNLAIQLVSTTTIKDISFDLQLPKGMILYSDDQGTPSTLTLNESATNNGTTKETQEFTINTGDLSAAVKFTGSTGAPAKRAYFNIASQPTVIATIPFYVVPAADVADWGNEYAMEDGANIIKLSNIKLVDYSSSTEYTGESWTTVYKGNVTDTDPVLYGDYTSEAAQTALKNSLTENTTSIDLTSAVISTKPEVVNPNTLVYASSEIEGDNVIVNKTCSNLVLTDGKPFNAPAKFTATTASYSRTMSNDWGTICLPYAVTSDASEAYYKINGIEEGVLTIEKYETLPAGTPALVKKLSVSEIAPQSSSVTVNGALKNVTGDVTMIGSYSNDVAVTDANAYYIKNNKFYKCNERFFIDAFRAYFTTSDVDAKSVINIGDEEVNAINALVGNSDVTIEAVYNEQGMLQNGLQNGLNIVKMSNGKTQKIMVK